MKVIKRKIGLNRGKARLWIEGESLASMGWLKGKRYDVEYTVCNGIVITACPNGKRKIAGTDSRPIIDMNTDKIRLSCGDCESVAIYIEGEAMTILPERMEFKKVA